MFSLGIDVGYSSVKVVVLDGGGKAVHRDYRLHKGRMGDVLGEVLRDMRGRVDAGRIAWGAMTGSGCKQLSRSGGFAFVNEAACLVEGALWADASVRSVAEIGGQSAKYITQFSESDKSRIKISMNPNCSAGTGSFLEEQVSRLGLGIEDYSRYAERATSVPRIAGRCSVFAKTDITHHQQEGAAVEDILVGLAHATVRNYRTSVMRRLPRNKPVMLAGGVFRNKAILKAVAGVLKIDESEIIIPDGFDALGAAGAALVARSQGHAMDADRVAGLAGGVGQAAEIESAALPALAAFGSGDADGRHVLSPGFDVGGGARYYLGVDVGSTSTNLVLMDGEGGIVAYRYLRTLGRPRDAVAEGLRQIGKEVGGHCEVAGVCTTGSGRYLIGRLIGADVVKDEITAQAKAAVTLDPQVDTVFEIGGQDSKFISLSGGVVVDFQMNRICAAGTGSFLEEQAKKLGVDIDGFGETALASAAPINLGERCTVFIESSMAAHLSQGAAVDDLISGLCYSIAKNYLHRVVGHKRVGERIFLQGGVAFNQGVVNAFRSLTGKDVRVPPFFSVTGAYGAALLAREEAEAGTGASAFKGFAPDMSLEARPEPVAAAAPSGESFNERTARTVFEGYDGVMDPSRKTIGMPRALFTYGMYPMFKAFFDTLGYNVLLSEPTNEETIRLCQDYSLEETCFPVKLVNGHVAELVAKGVDYIFFPDLYTVLHPDSKSRQDYGCAYMQLAFKLMNQAMELDKRGIKLLAPTIAFNLGPDFMRGTFAKLGGMLDRSPEQVGVAMQRGMQAFKDFESRREEGSREAAKTIAPGEKAFVLISKTYGVADPFLNLGIPDKLAAMGHKVLPFYALPEVETHGQHPNMYWPFGQHIIEAARMVREHPNLYAIFLTHHGCGPDTVFTHYVKEIMGDKPYLNVEVDEHSSDVGVTTRVEAFVNSLDKVPGVEASSFEAYGASASAADCPVALAADTCGLPSGTTLWLPALHPYAEIGAQLLRTRGVAAGVLGAPDRDAVDIGRSHTMTNEYYSMTLMLGNALRHARSWNGDAKTSAFLLPQSEGAEVDGQYARFLRGKLDQEGFAGIPVVAPFIEDLADLDADGARAVFTCLLAGDLVLAAPRSMRAAWLERVLAAARDGSLTLESLSDMAAELGRELRGMSFAKRLLVVGEPMVLFCDVANNHTFASMEDAGHRVLYAPMSECLWTFWKDHAAQADAPRASRTEALLAAFEGAIGAVSAALAGESHFSPRLDDLRSLADGTLGYYAGAFGRYREARILGGQGAVDGIVNATSMYENTGITLSVLHKGWENGGSKPVLNLTFDGDGNENDATKLESFLYYI